MKDRQVYQADPPVRVRKGCRHRRGDLLLFCAKDREDPEGEAWILRGLKAPFMFRKKLPSGKEAYFDARELWSALLCVGIKNGPEGPRSVYVWYDWWGRKEPSPEILKGSGFLPAVRTETEPVPPYRIRSVGWYYTFSLSEEGFYTGSGGSLAFYRAVRCPEEADRFLRLAADAGAAGEPEELSRITEAFRAFSEEKIRSFFGAYAVGTLTEGTYGEPALLSAEETEKARTQSLPMTASRLSLSAGGGFRP